MRTILFLSVVVLAAGACDDSPTTSDEAPKTNDGEVTSRLGEICETNDDCGPSEFCSPMGYACGDDFDDVCSAIPTECAAPDGPPICGCDGVVYESPCEADRAGVGTALYDNTCEPPELPTGTFRCGHTFCSEGTEICVEDFEVEFTCAALPTSCDPENRTCDTCIPESLSGCACTNDGRQVVCGTF